MPYPYIQKVAGSYDLPMSELLQVSPDVPPQPTDGGVSSNAAARETTWACAHAQKPQKHIFPQTRRSLHENEQQNSP
ncbi:hypothetical protein Tco_0723476 [Tanacetum coccineum]